MQDGNGNYIYTIFDHKIIFPYQAYRSQLALMYHSIKAMRDSENVLLESATGSGKSVGFLCGGLGWIEGERSRRELVEMERREGGYVGEEGDESGKEGNGEGMDGFGEGGEGVKKDGMDEEEEKEGGFGSDDEDFAPRVKFRDTSWQRSGKRQRGKLKELLSSQALPSEQLDSSSGEDDDDDGNGEDVLPMPKLFYASRTHTQLTHIVSELRKTTYRPSMTILASRNEYCINSAIKSLPNRDEACRASLLAQSCPYSPIPSSNKPRGSQFVSPDYKVQPWDIEDLVTLGKEHGQCPYYHALDLYKDAELVLAPYNYLIDPIVRKARNISVRNYVVVLDEAHNIETHARDAASFTANLVDLHDTESKVATLSCEDSKKKDSDDGETEGQIVARLMGSFAEWVDGVLERNELIGKGKGEERAWEGQALENCLRDAGITPESVERASNALGKLKASEYDGQGDEGDDSDAEKRENNETDDKGSQKLKVGRKGRKLTGRPRKRRRQRGQIAQVDISGNLDEVGAQKKGLRLATELLSALEYCLANPEDYVLAVERKPQHWNVTVIVHLWCMNAGVPLGEISSKARSIIVTSGTLSPLGAFAAELGFPFAALKSFSMNIAFPITPSMQRASQQSITSGQGSELNTEQQPRRIFASVVGYGKGSVKLEATWRKAGLFDFQDSTGQSLVDYCLVVSGGVLVFLPSYGMMDKLIARWKVSGIWEKLDEVNRGVVFAEQKGLNESELYAQGVRRTGKGLMFAVCRGKVSEGVDFRDDEVRAVVIIGIPFPSVASMQVAQKKIWNDHHCCRSSSQGATQHGRPTTRMILKGNEWYRLQAFRALNQALGRCVRHRFDYGAILLLDVRFKRAENIASLPTWTRAALRCSPQLYTHENTMTNLRLFFEKIKTFSQSQSSPLSPALQAETLQQTQTLPVSQSPAEIQCSDT